MDLFERTPHVNLFITNETKLHVCFTMGPRQLPENRFQGALDLHDRDTFSIILELIKDKTGLKESYDMEIGDLENQDCPFHHIISMEAKKFDVIKFRLPNSTKYVGEFDVDFNTLSTPEGIEYDLSLADDEEEYSTSGVLSGPSSDEETDSNLNLADNEEDDVTPGVLSEPSSDEETDSNLGQTDNIDTADDIDTVFFTPGVPVLSDSSSDEDTDSRQEIKVLFGLHRVPWNRKILYKEEDGRRY